MYPPPPRLRHRSFLIAAFFAVAVAGGAGAQTPVTIDSGMTQDSVIKRLGQPLSIRTYGTHTYLLYPNGCEKNCGMSDLVTLDSGRVVDAIFRSPARRYSGKSSSPEMIPADLARGAMAADSTRPRHIVVPPQAEPKMDSAKKATPEKKAAPKKKAGAAENAAPKKKAEPGKTAPAAHPADTAKKAAPPKKPD